MGSRHIDHLDPAGGVRRPAQARIEEHGLGLPGAAKEEDLARIRHGIVAARDTIEVALQPLVVTLRGYRLLRIGFSGGTAGAEGKTDPPREIAAAEEIGQAMFP